MTVFLLLTLALGGLASGHLLREKMTLLQDPSNDDAHVVVVAWKDDHGDGFQCQMFTDQNLIKEVLKTSGDVPVRRNPTKEEMAVIREECDSFSDMSDMRRRRRAADSEEEEGGWNVIFPGTKWCGNGDIAENFNDLGTHADTDKCCRAHDECDDLIPAGETKYNLTNKSSFTKLSCKCDDDFYDCLHDVNSLVSNTVGNTYFNLLRRECYKKDYPIGKKCIKNTSLLRITCLEYERDFSSPPVYQWISAKIYKNLPVPGPLDVSLKISDQKMELLRQLLP